MLNFENPELANRYNNAGLSLHEAGRIDDAISAFRQALALGAPSFELLHNYGLALIARNYLAEAIHVLRQAVAMNPGNANTFNNLGSAMLNAHHYDEAAEAFRHALSLRPDDALAMANLATLLKDLGSVEEAISLARRAIEINPVLYRSHSNLLLNLNYLPETEPGFLAREHELWYLRHAKPLERLIQPYANDRTPDRKIRIGFISPDFYQHVVARFLRPILDHRNRAEFEFVLYSSLFLEDQLTQTLRASADVWRNIAGQPEDVVAQLVRRDQVDILFDLSGHTAHHHLLVFAQKSAPIQISFLGYPNTTGLPTIDYRFTDALADPPGTEGTLYAEKLVRLPNCAWCFQPLTVVPVAPRRAGPITFGSFNTLAKITNQTLILWSKILAAIPDSRLLLKATALESAVARTRIFTFMQSQSIAPGRLELFSAVNSYSDHLSLYGRIDISLDSFPYHGTTTTCESLFMGVPVITCAGNSHASRVGVSLLTSANLPDFIATSEDDYAARAIELAKNPERLSHLRATLRDQLQSSPLMNAIRYTQDFESALRQIWKTWCSEKSGH